MESFLSSLPLILAAMVAVHWVALLASARLLRLRVRGVHALVFTLVSLSLGVGIGWVALTLERFGEVGPFTLWVAVQLLLASRCLPVTARSGRELGRAPGVAVAGAATAVLVVAAVAVLVVRVLTAAPGTIHWVG